MYVIERQISELANGVVDGDRRAVSRAISLCDPGAPAEDRERLISDLWPHAGQAQTIGITGPPGVGKSTLVSELIAHVREQDLSVGVVAVDPSSPETGGALLGDRIRMKSHYLDQGVFIRSMSASGHLGGVAEATFLSMAVLDASGKDVVIVETVGVGQSEVEVRSMVDSVVVALQPVAGDSVQAMKSGLMEIPDVLCLNKKDLPESETAKRILQGILYETDEAIRPVLVETNAEEGEGINGLWQAIQDHRTRLGEAGLQKRRRKNLGHEIAAIAASRATLSFEQAMRSKDGRRLLDDVTDRTLDPLQGAKRLAPPFR
jgi:LAO/AO transport system kinase